LIRSALVPARSFGAVIRSTYVPARTKSVSPADRRVSDRPIVRQGLELEPAAASLPAVET
jgi:hypothetical protein